jgi:Uma2 family endonuclease
MVARPTAPPLTVEHYRNLPETGPRYQLIDGDLYMAPAPNRFHQEISRNLEFLLMKYLEEHPVGELTMLRSMFTSPRPMFSNRIF